MPEGHPLPYRELLRRLSEFKVVERRMGKGAARILFKADVEGLNQSYPIHPHNEGDEIDTHIIKTILRRFKIKEEDFW